MRKTQKYFIVTFGCQMNLADSEKIAGFYQLKGYKQAKSVKDADVVVINSCSVRQSAEDRVMGLVNNLKKLKIENCKLKIILTGCMLRYTLYRLKKMLPGVDEFVKLKDLTPTISNQQLAIRNSKTHSWVPIMEGCDNFCTYCVVPYARGREVSRPFEEIACEVRQLAKRGYKHVTLLGQNVNSYGKKWEATPDKKAATLRTLKFIEGTEKKWFARLLRTLHKIEGLERISFITSNPQDLTDDIIQAMRLPKIDRYLHLPVQSGDDKILRKMNRKYTARQYLSLIKRIREKIPDIKIGTDIIVGFPGETKEQFENTVKLCKKVGFTKAYIAKYSPRPGTAAYKFSDNIPYNEKRERWEVLDKLVNEASPP